MATNRGNFSDEQFNVLFPAP